MEKEETWETVQTKTFVNWINAKLEKGERRYKEESITAPFSFRRVLDLKKDLQDGIILHSLLYSATGSILRFNPKPVLVVHKRENIERIIEYLKQNKVEMINIGAADIQEGSIKLTLALVWRFIMAFSLQEVREEGESIRERILKWCQRKIGPYGVNVQDFHKSWKDGKAISALVHSDVGGFVFDDGESEEICARAIGLAQEYLQVPSLISAEDLVGGSCDEKSLLTYLIEYYSASVKNNGKIKRKLAEQAVLHAFQGVSHLKEQISNVFSLLQREIPDLEKKKKELDSTYNKVRLAEETAIRSIISYIIQVDILNRMAHPYTPAAIELPESFKHLPVVGVYDALSVVETLRGWNLSEGKQSESSDEKLFNEIFNELMSLSRCVTFIAAVEFLGQIAAKIEEALSVKKKVSLELLSFSAAESSRVMKQRLSWCLAEVVDGVRRFRESFREQIAREKDSVCSPLSLEMQSLSLPGPHKSEWALLGGRDVYLKIVSEGLSSAGAREFTPIAPESEK